MNRSGRARTGVAGRFFVLIFSVGALAAVGLFTVAVLGEAAHLGPGAADLNPVARVALRAYLSARADDLARPAGGDDTPVTFSVQPGESAGEVAERLVAQHLIREAGLLEFYLRYQGMDDAVEAGDFILRQTMTVPEVADALADARAREIVVRIAEGWRLEQIADALSANPSLAVAHDDFMVLAGPNSPRTGSHPILSELAPGASLEGYLFPDTYLLRPEASAGDLLDKMLANFEMRLPSDYRSAAAGRGLTLHQAITVASLIEREAAVDDERPLIASVIFNRLAIGQRLEIDATVQYALGQPGDWWPRLDGLDLRAIASPYNTYAVAGLPAGPIANPGLGSVLAAVSPATTDFLYYRARCDGSGRHAFAVTYEEHLANACQ